MDNQQSTDSPAQSSQPAATPSKAPMMYIIIIVLVVLAGGIFIARQKSSAPKSDPMMEESAGDADEAGDFDQVDAEDGEKMEKDTEVDSLKTADFEVEGGDFYFKPNILKVKKGQKVEIEFNNKAGFHDFVIDELNVKSKQIKAGETEDLEFTADKAGKFEFYCSVGKHRANGMKGTLIVE